MKNLIFVFLLIAMFAILNSFTKTNNDQEEHFVSIPSSLTKIQLKLDPNNHFILEINIFGDNIPTTKSKGSWKESDGYYILSFRKNKRPSFNILFPDKIKSNKNIEIIDFKSIKFKKNTPELFIYGIKCKKES